MLLKNEGGVLPLDKARMKTILVVGPDAYPGSAVGGGSARVVPFTTVSAVEGIRSFLGTGVTVYYDRGVPSLQELARTTEFVTEAQGGRAGSEDRGLCRGRFGGLCVGERYRAAHRCDERGG